MLEIGRVGRAHGLRGEVLVELLTDRTERLAPGSVLHCESRDALIVSASRRHQNRFIVSFDGIHDRGSAEAFRGCVLLAEPLDDPAELWAHDVIGCRVVDSAGAEHGTVESVQSNPASDLLVLDSGALVPVRFVVEQRGHDLLVDAPDGLFDL